MSCTPEDHRALSMLPEAEFRRVARNLKLWPAEFTEALGYRLLHGDCPNCPESLSCKIELKEEGSNP